MCTIREYENEDTLSNQICLERQLDNYVYIIVEGDFDEKVFSSLFHKDCEIRVAYGKEILDKSISELNERDIHECFAIRDRDYDILMSKSFDDNIILTDYRDLEMCILESDAISNILSLYKTNKDVNVIKNKLLTTILPLGYLRWLNDIEKIGLDFKTTKIEKALEKSTLEFDIKKYMSILHQNSNKRRKENGFEPLEYTVDILLEKLEKFKKDNLDISMSLVCNGHDFISAMSISLTRLFANYNTKDMSEMILANNFILSYHMDFFKTTNMYATLVKKEKSYNLLILNC